MLFYLFHHAESARAYVRAVLVLSLFIVGDLLGRHRQVGSLAGAAHLLNDNTGVLR